ncbi:response regulator [Salinadaptatus halalkaliphilus]|uniref:Response regulator n=1 Tax=Salinadaptatus halalkaliphilus TaxID=2419781 RepID=A0A4S3THW8_9EURY|nr:response regulator [Salinadaptatus halalkaliphilus]THE63531.1 response regulator [Salinadaptatus halalkaliphilus]
MTGTGDEHVNLIDILLIEPNPGDTRLFTESFAETQLTNSVYTVSDGDESLDFLYQRGEFADASQPDLILLEPQLPGTDGADILSRMNDEPVLSDIPVVVLTSSSVGEEIIKSHGLEADYYVQKPVEPEDFLEFVQEIEDLWLSIVQQPPTES